jgi:iron complex outermembrane receptor protein
LRRVGHCQRGLASHKYVFLERLHIERGSVNIGYRLSPRTETRFYVNANSWRQRLPGELTKEEALNTPRAADPEFLRVDQQRNIDSMRFANKTTLRFGTTTLDFGIFGVHRHVDHPIFRYLDYYVNDYGGFTRALDDRTVAGFRNRLVAGVNVHNGTIDYEEYQNLTGAVKGDMVFSTLDTSRNQSAYAENSFFVRPNVALVAGAQLLHAVRNREDRFLSNGDQSGGRTFNVVNPKAGVLWDILPTWQVFGNVSKSAEVPSFDVNSFASPASADIDVQTANTYEIGTRGSTAALTWDLAFYRAQLENELQCLTTSPFSPCTVVNADRTVHQGVEAGVGAMLVTSIIADGDSFSLNATYTYNDFFFDGDPRYGNNQLPGVGPHNIRAEVLYRHPVGLYAAPGLEWLPKAFFSDNANSLTVDPFELLSMKVGYNRGAGWSGYLEGRNLLDTRYISTTIIAGSATPASALFNPGYGRSVSAGILFKW